MMKESAATRKHHPFSASSLQCREVSPYWESTNSDSEASRAGTLQHESVDSDDLPEELSDVQAEAVVACKNYWGKILLNFPGGHFINEEYLHIDDEEVFDSDGTAWLGTSGGYLDRGIISADRKRAAICDWKFGMWSVEPAATNLQGWDYTLGLLNKFPTLEEVEVHFFLPHRDEVTTATFKREQFESMYLRVRTAVHRAMKAKQEMAEAKTEAEIQAALSKCKATTSSCLFCANVGRCPLVASFILQVGKKYAPVQVPECISPTLITDPQQVKLGLEVASLATEWAKGYRAQATAKAIEDDNFMPEGYRLREKKEREMTDPKKAEQIAKEFGLKEEQIDQARSLALTPLLKAARANAPRGEKEDAEDELSSKLLECGAIEYGKPVIFLERLRT